MTAPFRRSFRPAAGEVITYQAVRLTGATADVGVLYAWNVINIDGNALGCFFARVNSTTALNQSDAVVITGTTAGGAQEIHFLQCVFGGEGGASAGNGMNLVNCSGVNVIDCDVLQFNVCLNICPGTSTQSVYNCYFVNTAFDQGNDVVINMAPTSSGQVYLLHFSNCWADGSYGGNGITIAPSAGGSVNSIQFTGQHTLNNGGNGISISGASNIHMVGCIFAANSVRVTSTAGVYISASASHIQLIGCSCQGGEAEYPVTQITGVTIVAGATDCVVTGNDCTGNTTNSILNGSNVATNFISDNLGHNPVGQITNPTLATGTAVSNIYGSTAAVYVAGGTVTSIQIAGASGSFSSTGATSGLVIVPAGGQIKINYTGAATWNWQLL